MIDSDVYSIWGYAEGEGYGRMGFCHLTAENNKGMGKK